MSERVSESSNTHWSNQSDSHAYSKSVNESSSRWMSFFADFLLHLSVDICHSLLAQSHGVFHSPPNNLLPLLLNYRYTLITSLWVRQKSWKSFCDPPSLLFTTDTNTPTQILIFTANLHLLYNLIQLFLIPRSTAWCSHCQPSPWLQNQITNGFYSLCEASLICCELCSQTVHSLHI